MLPPARSDGAAAAGTVAIVSGRTIVNVALVAVSVTPRWQARLPAIGAVCVQPCPVVVHDHSRLHCGAPTEAPHSACAPRTLRWVNL